MRSTDFIADGVTEAMADRLFDAVAADDLGNPDVTVRVLLEDRFLAREILPRLDAATMLARLRQPRLARAA